MILSIFLLIVMVVIANVAYTYPRIRRSYRIAHNAVIHTGRFRVGNKSNPLFRLLVLGDSGVTGHEVPNFRDSTGGRLACRLGLNHCVDYLNQAGFGKWIGDIDHEQISGKWDLTVLVLGSNDLLHGGDFKIFEKDLKDLLDKLKDHSLHLIVSGPGNLSGSKIFPWWYRLRLYRRQKRYAVALAEAAHAINGHYCNPLTVPELFRHRAKDGLHLGIHGNRRFADFIWDQWLAWENPKNRPIATDAELAKVPVEEAQ